MSGKNIPPRWDVKTESKSKIKESKEIRHKSSTSQCLTFFLGVILCQRPSIASSSFKCMDI